MANPIAVPGTVVPVGSLVTPGGAQGIAGLQGPAGTSYSASQSVLLTGTNFTLTNDAAAPVSGRYYGVSNGTRGWFLPGFINVLDYGADRTGASDSTTAINNAITAMPSTGWSLYFPAGSYLISSTITLNKPGHYFGDGMFSTYIITSSATAVVFSITQPGTTISELSIQSSVTRTGGFYIDTPSAIAFVFLRGIQLIEMYHGVHINWNQGGAYDCMMLNHVSSSGYGWYVDYAADVFLQRCQIFRTTGTTQLGYGIVLSGATSGVNMDGCDFTYSGECFAIDIASGTLQGNRIRNCYFDTGTTGVLLAPSGGVVRGLSFIGCWMATHAQQGVTIAPSGSATLEVDFIGCQIFNNTGAGFLCQSANATYSLQDSEVSGNGSHGVQNTATSMAGFRITGCKIGPSHGFLGNNGYGITMNTGTTNFIIANNILLGNALGEQFGTGTGTFVNTNNV